MAASQSDMQLKLVALPLRVIEESRRWRSVSIMAYSGIRQSSILRSRRIPGYYGHGNGHPYSRVNILLLLVRPMVQARCKQVRSREPFLTERQDIIRWVFKSGNTILYLTQSEAWFGIAKGKC